MKLSDCWVGRVVQHKDYTYDEAIDKLMFGHITGFESSYGLLHVAIRLPDNSPGGSIRHFLIEQLKPLED